MLKFYTKIDLIIEENRSYVFPLLFDLYFRESSVLSKYYSAVSSIEQADIVILPLEYSFSSLNYKTELKALISKAKTNKKPIWIYTGGDYGYTINDECVYNFRLGGFKSKFNNRTIVIPSFISDPYLENIEEDFSTLKKQEIPKIGFVGHATTGFLKYFKELKKYFEINFQRITKKIIADYQSFYPSSIKRLKYLNQLVGENKVNSNFIFRGKYRAGVKTLEDREKTTKEFYNNIFESPYIFCMRGNGNFSVRLYETLAVGRIPVLLDTDCLLPLNNSIDWEKHCLIIKMEDEDVIPQKLIEYHDKISEEDFKNLQISNRNLWENYLTRHTFFKHIHDAFVIKDVNYA